jgi:hypothetical protein
VNALMRWYSRRGRDDIVDDKNRSRVITSGIAVSDSDTNCRPVPYQSALSDFRRQRIASVSVTEGPRVETKQERLMPYAFSSCTSSDIHISTLLAHISLYQRLSN